MTISSSNYVISDTKKLYGSEEQFPLIIVDTPKCNAVISMYGGQILNFQATGKAPLLWLSPNAVFKTGKAIRGGIPICAPWFGNHPNFSLNHGFARISLWEQDSIEELNNGDLVINLTLTENELSREYNYQQFTMQLQLTLGNNLTIKLSFENHSSEIQTCEWAMHSYLQVKNCEEATVNGLVNHHYQDKTLNNECRVLTQPQSFIHEVDLSFDQGSLIQTIEGSSTTTVSGHNCDSVILWNPGKELADKMPDISNYHQFICVERGAINTNSWKIYPQNKSEATMVISN